MKLAKFVVMGFLTAACSGAASAALAQSKEVSEIKITRQFGLAFVPLMVMEHEKLIEKHAQKLGLPGLKAVFPQLQSTQGINDALLAGQVDFAPNGAPSLLTIWSRTRGTPNEVRGVIGINQIPFWLNVNRPEIKSIRDFTEKDKIVVTAIKVSVPAIILQMAAEKEWGRENYAKLDSLTVSMSHPDGMVAFLSKREITAHFTSPPFMHQELKYPGIRRLMSSDDVLGGPTVGSIMMTTSKFREANPRAFQTFVAATMEAIDFVNSDKRRAAEIYLKISGDKKNSVDEIERQLKDPNFAFIATPRNFMKYAEFMHRIGTLKVLPSSWKDVFFPEIHKMPGS